MNKIGKRLLATLIIISILASLLVGFMPSYFITVNDRKPLIEWKIDDLINASLYGNMVYEMDDYGKYYIHSVKPKKNTNDSRALEITDDEDYDIGYTEKINSNLRDIYLTNDLDFNRKIGPSSSFNPKDIKFNTGYYVVKGSLDEDGNLNIYNEDYSTNNDFKSEVMNILNSSIKSTYSFMKHNEDIKYIEFAYAVNVDNGLFLNDINRISNQIDISRKMMISIVISSVIFLLLAIFSKFELMEDDGFFNSIIKVPVEIVIILFMLLFGITISLYDFNYYGYGAPTNIYYSEKIFIILGTFIILFFIGLTIYYIVYGLKGMRYGFKNSKLVNNSIIYRVFRPLFYKVLRPLFRRFKLTDFRTSTVAITFFVILILGYILIEVFRHNKVMLFVSYTILVFLVAGFILKYFEDIILVRDATEKIAKGDFKYKLDEDIRFSSIAKNLNSIGDDLDEKVENAVKSERMKTELITNVSHDLKTPLTSIINYSELINSPDTTDEDIKKYAEIINDKSNQLKVLVENLFEISKVSSNNIELELEDVDLYQLTLQVLGSYEDKYDSKKIETIIKADDVPYIVNIDGNQTSRILDNLFSNIEKYAMENSRVYINFEDLGNSTELVIKNISKYPLNISEDELMERFIRGDESRNTEGSGLGLSIAKSLTEIQGGNFYLEIDGDLFKTTIIF